MPLRSIGGFNGFMPEATGMVVGFVRDPKTFAINRYCQLVKAPAPSCYYKTLAADEPTRVVDDTQTLWRDGDFRPRSGNHQAIWEDTPILIQRRNYDYQVGYQAIETARRNGKTDVQAINNAILLSQAMTARTTRVLSRLTNAANWVANVNTFTATALGGGKWDASTVADRWIFKGLTNAQMQLTLATNGVINQPDMMRLVLSPSLAQKMGNSPEMYDLFKQSQFSGMAINPGNAKYGLPDKINDLEVVVEDTVRTVVRRKANGALAVVGAESGDKRFCLSGDVAIIMAKEPGLDGNYGVPNFSTLQLYYYEYEMAVETFDEPTHKLVNCNIVDQTEPVVINQAGILITDTTSVAPNA